MKKLLLTSLLFISIKSFAQNNVYVITEKFDGLIGFVPSYDSVFVTNPSGITTKYNIPNYIGNTAGHDSAFNQILNGIINQGYKIIETHSGGTAVNNQLLGGNYIFILKTFYLGQPWTTNGLKPAGVKNSQIKIKSIYPNPADEYALVKFETSLKDSKLILINSNSIIMNEYNISNLTEFNCNLSSLKSGSYFFILVNDQYYSESMKFIKL